MIADEKAADEQPEIDSTDAKYGNGVGWRFYAISDLFKGIDLSIASREPVFVSFD